MSKRNLIVAVQESAYLERLSEYIRHSPFGECWQLTGFTNPAALGTYLRGGYAVDLLALQPGLLEELGELTGGIVSAVLVDRVIADARGLYRHQLLQYQPLPQLLQAFAAVYAESAQPAVQRLAVKDEAVCAVAVYSPAGGVGKTTLALQLAAQATACGSRVFYLNLEQWNSAAARDVEGSEDLSRLLYTLQTSPGKAHAQLVAVRKRHPTLGFDYIAPCGNAEERLSLTAEHAEQLLAAMKASGEYDLIVADLDSRMDPVHIGAFKACGHVLWLLTADQGSLRKTELAVQYGSQKYGSVFEALLPKLRYVLMKGDVGGGFGGNEAVAVASLPITVTLPFVKAWAFGGQDEVGGWSGAPNYRGAVDLLLRQLALLPQGGGGVERSNGSAAQGANPQSA
ncbi:nucleotide-binding protein [Paenibacillus silvisoli]|uniref:nucleotide-binding protein n=1 Tax=Paenibacillus silvisoli TaxID=3110539 RepID=UPI0028038A3D|nr:hypothetical protein [Paenibacillus silvisoli]